MNFFNLHTRCFDSFDIKFSGCIMYIVSSMLPLVFLHPSNVISNHNESFDEIGENVSLYSMP